MSVSRGDTKTSVEKGENLTKKKKLMVSKGKEKQKETVGTETRRTNG